MESNLIHHKKLILQVSKRSPLCLHLLCKVNYSFEWQQPFLLLRDEEVYNNYTLAFYVQISVNGEIIPTPINIQSIPPIINRKICLRLNELCILTVNPSQ
jgi:hypothetical protein